MNISCADALSRGSLSMTVTPLFSCYELMHFHYVTRKRNAVAYICSSYVADNVHNILCSKRA